MRNSSLSRASIPREPWARLEAEAAVVARRAQPEQAAASRVVTDKIIAVPASICDREEDVVHALPSGQPSRPHLALRIDARPPWSHPLRCFY